MKLIIMSSPDFFVEEDKIISNLFDKGMDIFHLRKPASEPVYSERLLTLLPREYCKQIVVHDHFYLKEEYGLRGIHLNQRNPEPPKGYKGHISRSCHSIEELRLYRKKFDYVIFSPAFDGTTPDDLLSAFSPAVLKQAAKDGLIDKKVMAMGGINCDNIRRLKDLGFGGVVVGSDVWKHFNIHQTQDYSELIGHFEQLRQAVG